MTLKMSRWIIFGVIFAFLPIFASTSAIYVFDKPSVKAFATPSSDSTAITSSDAHAISFVNAAEKALGNGELLIIICIICAGASGELYGLVSESANARLAQWRLLCGSMAMLIALSCAILFATIASAKIDGKDYNEFPMLFSVAIFLCGLIASGSCVHLSEK